MKYVFYRQLGRLFEAVGINIGELLRASSLPEDLLSRREIMLTEEEYFRLMEQVGLMTKGDEVIRIATNEGIETFSPPVFAAYCSGDGRNFLTRLAHYKRLVGPLQFIVTEQEKDLELEIGSITEGLTVPAFWAELEMVFILNLIRKATQADVKPVSVTFQHEVQSRALAEYLGCQPTHGNKNVLTLSQSDAALPFITRNESMWQYIEPELRRRLSEMEIDDSMAARVRSALVELLPAGKTTIDFVASKLCMSRRTLQRKLTDEHTTFQQQL
ncbi:MAG: AraC family transcriptional regulator ligand-binding domain-containing protein, partial [Prevotella sp.]|nr:AraC family transcriptional regulator ligand-binding domain-containing protein [Prevotella sp.]